MGFEDAWATRVQTRGRDFQFQRLIPSWTGSEQPRPFTFDHGCLIIGAGNQKLVWERAVKHG